jgi:ABC-type glycerol-3-phosphate transport system permease component
METILIIILWVIVGFWIAYKRNWYEYAGRDDQNFIIWMTVIFAPISLIIAFFSVMIIGKWQNN